MRREKAKKNTLIFNKFDNDLPKVFYPLRNHFVLYPTDICSKGYVHIYKCYLPCGLIWFVQLIEDTALLFFFVNS